MSVEEHIDFRAQVSGANIFIAQVRVRDFPLVETIANPTDGVGIGPWDPYADAGSFGDVMLHVGSAGDADEVESQFRRDGLNRILQSGLAGKNP